MLREALETEQLWVWLEGLGAIAFLPLRQSCAFIALQVLDLVALCTVPIGTDVHGGGRAYRYVSSEWSAEPVCMCEWQLLEALAGDAHKTTETLLVAQHRVFQSRGCLWRGAAGDVPSTLADGAAVDLPTPLAGLRHAAAAVSAADEAPCEVMQAEQVCGEQGLPPFAAPGGGNGGETQERLGGACLAWLVRCWRERRHAILRLPPIRCGDMSGTSGRGEAAEVELLLRYVCNGQGGGAAGGRCVVLCREEAVPRWRLRLAALLPPVAVRCLGEGRGRGGEGASGERAADYSGGRLDQTGALPNVGRESEVRGAAGCRDSQVFIVTFETARRVRASAASASEELPECPWLSKKVAGQAGPAGQGEEASGVEEVEHVCLRSALDLIVVDERLSEAGALARGREGQAGEGCVRTGEQWMRVPMLVSLQARSVPRLMLLEGWPREAEAGGGKEPWRRRVQHESQQEEALLRFVAPWWSDHALLGDTAGRQPAAAAAAAAHGQAALSQVPRRLCELAASLSLCVCFVCVFSVCVCCVCPVCWCHESPSVLGRLCERLADTLSALTRCMSIYGVLDLHRTPATWAHVDMRANPGARRRSRGNAWQGWRASSMPIPLCSAPVRQIGHEANRGCGRREARGARRRRRRGKGRKPAQCDVKRVRRWSRWRSAWWTARKSGWGCWCVSARL